MTWVGRSDIGWSAISTTRRKLSGPAFSAGGLAFVCHPQDLRPAGKNHFPGLRVAETPTSTPNQAKGGAVSAAGFPQVFG